MSEHLPYFLVGFLCALIPSLILLFMSARRRRERKIHYETLLKRALVMYADLSNDYINLLSCIGTGFIPKRLLNRRPSSKEIFHN